MAIFLDALDQFEDVDSIEDVEELAMEGLNKWFETYKGFGLLSTLLERGKKVMLLLAMQLRGFQLLPRQDTEEECWNHCLEMFNQQEELDYDDLIPNFDLNFIELDDEDIKNA